MTRKTNDNSLAAWNTLKSELTSCERWVLEGYEKLQELEPHNEIGFSDDDVREILDTTINKVTGRIGALLEKGCLKVIGSFKRTDTRTAVRHCKINPNHRTGYSKPITGPITEQKQSVLFDAGVPRPEGL